MFNNSLKKEALKIYEDTLSRYNASNEMMGKACERLYEVRTNTIETIKLNETVINSIANTPKEFETKMGEVKQELNKFHETKEYAQKAYETSVKAGVNIVGGTAVGVGVATMAPTALMSIATTFGTASTGTAISALSGAAAQKAAVAWIGRTFAGFAVKGGAGMAAGNAFLALAGPVGWGITAASAGVSLISLSSKNKKLADEAVEEAKNIAIAREALDEMIEKVNALKAKTTVLNDDMEAQKGKILEFMNIDYSSLDEAKKEFLGTLVNNTLTLSVLLNETVE
ncbi:MAG: hypothetical protein E7252_10330 [Lachnospira sp.]|nr:hypothetical protein [Lachnospira sp.]